jgi:hypothetical protein
MASLEFNFGLYFSCFILSIFSAIFLTSLGQPTPCRTGLWVFQTLVSPMVSITWSATSSVYHPYLMSLGCQPVDKVAPYEAGAARHEDLLATAYRGALYIVASPRPRWGRCLGARGAPSVGSGGPPRRPYRCLGVYREGAGSSFEVTAPGQRHEQGDAYGVSLVYTLGV